MKPKHTWTFGAAALAIAASISMAQSQPPKNDRSAQNVLLMRASTIIGMKVENAGGEKLGSVNNLAIDLNGGQCRYAIVSSGGTLGVGDKLHAIPFKAIKFSGGKEVCILEVPKDRLDAAPEFTNDRWNTIGDEQWGTTIYEYYRVKPDFTVEKTTVKATTVKPAVVKGSDVVGMDVHNQKDEDLGEIEDLMVDVNSGRIAYAVLAFGGWLGVGEKLFAVPWQALNFNADKKQMVLSVEKDKLKNAPGFDKNHWPEMNDLTWSKDVHAFYGSDPNWIYGYTGASAAGGDKAMGGWGMNEDYNRKFDSKNVQAFTCTINEVSNTAPMKGMSDGTVLTCSTDKGETVYVNTGPKWYMEKQDRQVNKGEQIKVTGCRCDLGDGKPVVMATEIEAAGQVMKLRDKSGHPMWVAWFPSK